VSDFKLVPLAQGKYALDNRQTGHRIGIVRKDHTVKSFHIWDAYAETGEWIRGFGSRGEAEQAVVLRYRSTSASRIDQTNPRDSDVDT
jgi:hypothetical protein